MPEYEVIVTRDATESVVVKVQAPNRREADDVALDYAMEQGDSLDYRLDEGNFHTPYIPAPGEAELVNCTEDCAVHEDDCDGHCDHAADHTNACLNPPNEVRVPYANSMADTAAGAGSN